MTTENKLLDVSYVAAEDLSSDQYRGVVLTSTGVRRPNSAIEQPIGILQNKPASGEEAAVRLIGCGGISKVQANAAIAIGIIVGMEYVSAADAGKAQAAVSGQYPLGVIVEASDAEDDLASVLLVNQVQIAQGVTNDITDPGDAGAIPVTNSGVCPMTSAGAETRTLAIPSFIGQQLSLIDDVHVGNIIVTVASAVNQTGNNTLTFGAAADSCFLVAMQLAGVLVWRIMGNDGVALSTV